MKWSKLGIVERPLGTRESVSHCYVPTPIILKEKGIIRVYYASWDINNHGRIFYSDFDLDNPSKVVNRSKGPVLGLGKPGTFDSDGVSPQCAILEDNKIYLLYQGFQRTAYPNISILLTGLAVSDENGNFTRYSQVPFLERSALEPYIRSAPFLMIEDDSIKLWYTSGISGWEPCKDKRYWDSYPKYDIALITTKKLSKVQDSIRSRCFIKRNDELGVSRPWVLKSPTGYVMWFSYRREDLLYGIGCATSVDGLNWKRFAESGIKPDKLYDNEMVAFGAVIKINNELYMYYNGNKHGKEGIALAKWEMD